MLLQPIMLAWIAGAVVPLVLHLLSKSRYRAVPWGAMMFLTGTASRWYQSARLKQLALLLLRMGAIGTLAVALARPVIASRHLAVPNAGLVTANRAAVVIILDDSASMGYQRDGKSRLDAAREIALQILSTLRRGDQATLLLAGTRENASAVPPGPDLQTIASQLADLQPDTGQADFATELRRAADLLAHTPATEQQIYLICDGQASSWRNVIGEFRQSWLKGKIVNPGLTVFQVGGNESDNLAVEAIQIPDNTFIREQPTQVQVRIRNYGPATQPSVPLSVWSGARTLGRLQVAVPPHSSKVFPLTVRFAEPGSRVISAAINSTGLTSDDRLDVAADVIEPYQALVLRAESVATKPSTEPATQPSVSAPKGRAANLVINTDTNWSPEYLRQFDVLILDDIPTYTQAQAKLLRDFLSTGRGVLFLPGKHSNVENYNQILFQSGHGILPAMLRPLVTKPIGTGNVNRQHPIFHMNVLRPENFSEFFPIGPHLPDSRVIGRLSNGEAWCVDASINRGRVILLTASEALVSADSTQPVLQSIIRYLGGGKAVDRNLSPGQPIVAEIDQTIIDRTATVQAPLAAVREPAIVNSSANHTQIRYVKTLKPGTYRLRYRSDEKEKILNYVVGVPPLDSDLTPLTEIQWQSLKDRVKFEKVDLTKTSVANAINLQRGGREIWIDLLGFALVLMVVEMCLSRIWST